MDGLPRDICRAVKMGNHVRNHERESVELGIPAVWSGGSLHAEEGCRCHLASGHSVDSVVDEDHHYVLSSAAGMDDFRRAD